MNYRKILFYTGLVAGVIVLSLVLTVFLFKDRIIRSFIAEANKHLNTPVTIKHIDVGILRNFPNLSIVLTDVYIEDSHPGTYPLVTAGRVAFKLNPFDVYNGIFRVTGISIRDSETNLKINEDGKTNYDILKPVEAGAQKSGSFSMDLHDVVLKSTKVSYYDISSRQHFIFLSPDLNASISMKDDVYKISATGEVTTEKLSIDGRSFLAEKTFNIHSTLDYNDADKSLLIKPSNLKLKNSSFLVEGTYGWKEVNNIDINVDGKDTDIQTLLSLLPEGISTPWEKYQSKGEVYFSSRLHGVISKSVLPALNIDFGFRNATIYHPQYKSRIEKATVNGSFSSSNLRLANKSSLVLRDLTGTLNREPFTANFAIREFDNPMVEASFRGNVDAAALYGFFPLEQISNVGGNLLADVSFRGRIELLRNKSTAQKVTTQGSVELRNISLKYGKDKVPLSNLSGTLQFSNNDLALSNVSARFGNSDFLFNGFFKNVITFLLFENQPVGIETDLKSDHLDLNELLRIGYGSDEGQSGGEYSFAISRNVYLNFNCDVRNLVYKRFAGKAIKGDLLVKNKVAVSRRLSLNTMGGHLTLSGIVDANNPKAIDVMCTSRLNGIHLDSVFYVFENFDQNFIEDRHLKGQVTADVNFEMTLNQHLKLFPETLLADISAVIRNGELNNFEPMKKLNRFLDDEGLSRLRFSDLRNDIHIEKKVISIPQMDIRSNVTDIRISGTHTFDQQIDYHLVTPLRGRKKFTDQQAGSALDNEGTGQSKLYLKITGTTDDYRIGFDTDAIKKKIVTDIRQEFREIKEGFRKREEEKVKELEVEEDEYFDW